LVRLPNNEIERLSSFIRVTPYGPEREKITVNWRIPQNEYFHEEDGLDMWKAWGRMENVLKSLVWKPKDRDHLEDLCVNGRIIF
jgi:hypothetical protein